MHFLDTIDLAALFWIQSKHRSWLNVFMEGVTHLGDRLMIAGVVLAVFALCVVLRQVRLGLLLLLCALLAGGLSETVKGAVKRPRPDVAFALVARPPSASFPSGHALLSMAVYGSLALAAVRRLRRRWQQILVLCGTGVLILVIGCSRLYLGVHYVTDVVGGWFAGGAIAMLFLWLDRRWAWPSLPPNPQPAAVVAEAQQPGGLAEQAVTRAGW
jgi:undecaprenyl-diphosphatase